MDFAIEGKSAHVIDAGSPLGRACAAALAAEGVTLRDEPSGCDIVVASMTDRGGSHSALTEEALEALRVGWEGVVDAVTAYRGALPTMVEHGWGRFVWVGSALAKSIDADDAEIDAITTLGMLGLHKVITSEEAPHNVTSNAVLRGGAATDDDVAAAVAFLCSQGAGYLSGITMTVDGGAGSAVY